MIISIHLPKTAGTSFRELLSEEFNKSLLADYHVYPRMLSREERIVDAYARNKRLKRYTKYIHKLRNIRCIHGHFVGVKYQYYLENKETKLVTWLRDPAERLASHYHFWKRTYEPHIHTGIRKTMMDEKWTLEQFALHPEMRNRYSFFLTDLELDRFSFVGIVERMDEDMKVFSKKYLRKANVRMPELNRSSNRESYYADHPELLLRLKEYHKKDYELYNYFVENPRH